MFSDLDEHILAYREAELSVGRSWRDVLADLFAGVLSLRPDFYTHEGLQLGDQRLARALDRVIAGHVLRVLNRALLLPTATSGELEQLEAVERDCELFEASRLLAELEAPGWVFTGAAKETAIRGGGNTLRRLGWVAHHEHWADWCADVREVDPRAPWDVRIQQYRYLAELHYHYVGVLAYRD